MRSLVAIATADTLVLVEGSAVAKPEAGAEMTDVCVSANWHSREVEKKPLAALASSHNSANGQTPPSRFMRHHWTNLAR
jgi:hypothetical protein